jgi:hypothetical protein
VIFRFRAVFAPKHSTSDVTPDTGCQNKLEPLCQSTQSSRSSAFVFSSVPKEQKYHRTNNNKTSSIRIIPRYLCNKSKAVGLLRLKSTIRTVGRAIRPRNYVGYLEYSGGSCCPERQVFFCPGPWRVFPQPNSLLNRPSWGRHNLEKKKSFGRNSLIYQQIYLFLHPSVFYFIVLKRRNGHNIGDRCFDIQCSGRATCLVLNHRLASA